MASQADAANTSPTTSFTLSTEQLQDIIKCAIAGAMASVHQPSTNQGREPAVKRPDRPLIDLNCSENRWSFFFNKWHFYKRQAKLPDSAPEELRMCCTEDLQMELFNFVGPSIDTLNEESLLSSIKSLAVKGKNMAVHRQEFYAMRQASGQPVQQFLAKLKAKAEHCQFHVKCSSSLCNNTVNSYAIPMITDQLIVGLVDTDIQGEVLAKHSQLKTFDQTFELIQAIEDGKRAKDQLSHETAIHQSSISSQSMYKQRKSPKEIPKQARKHEVCPGCGSDDHGPGTSKSRKDYCPAWSVNCDHCKIRGHLATVCRKKLKITSRSALTLTGSCSSTNTEATSETTTPTYDTQHMTSWLFSTTEDETATQTFVSGMQRANRYAWKSSGHLTSRINTIPSRIIVPHMEWDTAQQGFKSRRPDPLPQLRIKLAIIPEAHSAFNHPVSTAKCVRVQNHSGLEAYADSGAQTCACGMEILRSLGLDESDLIPTSHRILGVTATAMTIAGVFFARLSVGTACTRQMVYVGKNTTGLFLSHTALRELGVLPKGFPTAHSNFNKMTSSPLDDPNMAPCGCPRRTPPPAKPDALPFTPVDENRDKLESWILDRYKASAFNTCEHQPLPSMSGEPMNIHFKPECNPVAYHSPIPVPHHWKNKVNADLDRDVRLGIIEPVPPGTPTVWCSRMVIVPKKDGSPRRTVDLQNLNAATYRATHHTASPFNQVSQVPPNTYKTVLDAWNGYHSLHLSPSARDATTFITEWGRYRYRRAPQGFHAAGDGYTKSFDDITMDVQRKTKCIDDTLLWDSDITSSFWHTIDYIDLCASNGIVFNPTKFHFAKREVEFAGFTVSETGIKPSAALLDAILKFPKPNNITDARSWFGLVNQVAYNIATSDYMHPFRDLLKPGNWYWDETLDNVFEKSKQDIAKIIQQGVKSFEPNRPTILSTDWSKTGLGFALLQKHCRCSMHDAPNCCPTGWKLVFAGSRFTTSAESRYAPVEGEALAVTYGLEKSRMFTLGCGDLTVVTDHKPLVKILGDCNLDNIKNPRLFNLKEKTLLYRYNIKHVPGTWHCTPDACSRNPSSVTTLFASFFASYADTDSSTSSDLDMYSESCIRAALSGASADDPYTLQAITIERVAESAQHDQEYIALSKVIQQGFPDNITSLPSILHPYWKLRHELYCTNGIILYGGRVVIPTPLRKNVLECLHSAHQGVVGMKSRARSSVYWPGLSNAIINRRAQCKTCNTIAPSQPHEPLQPSPSPLYPFQMAVADYFQLNGNTYLAYADRYTGWVSICKFREANAETLKRELRTVFGIYGAPEELGTDGGQPFASYDVQRFLCDWGVGWRQSTTSRATDA